MACRIDCSQFDPAMELLIANGFECIADTNVNPDEHRHENWAITSSTGQSSEKPEVIRGMPADTRPKTVTNRFGEVNEETK